MNLTNSVYIMAFGPHPDDIDYGCGWLLSLSASQGKNNIWIDLTPSQLSSRWDCEWRCLEAQNAAKILWLQHRFNLWMEDLKIQDDENHRMQIATMIRKYKPEIILLPNFVDRHPDHEATAKLIKNSIFTAWLSKIDYQWLAPHRPRLVLEYMIWDDFDPDLIIWLDRDIYDVKRQAIHCYKSQAETNERAKHYFDGRAMKLWRQIGKQFWEWYRIVGGAVWTNNLDNIYSRGF